MVAPADALALIPDDLSAAEAAPLLCAGVTTYNALRESGARPGDLVAILGIGGLGHLGVQFAAKMGFRTVAIARGRDKEKLARQLGAHVYLDSQSQDVPAELMRLGGAKTILATVTSGKAMSAVIPGLAVRGRLVVVGVGMDPIEVSALDLIGGSRTVTGHAWGALTDAKAASARWMRSDRTVDTLRISSLTSRKHHAEASLVAHHLVVSLGCTFQRHRFDGRPHASKRAEGQCVLRID
jgi:D-arabinose 1-dehydrogenase-like Zn-dependent alcohol dehydrogenase